MHKLVKEFLNKFGDEVFDMPDSMLDLIMDDHKCVGWLGVEYFIAENNTMYSDVEELISTLLIECYQV